MSATPEPDDVDDIFGPRGTDAAYLQAQPERVPPMPACDDVTGPPASAAGQSERRLALVTFKSALDNVPTASTTTADAFATWCRKACEAPLVDVVAGNDEKTDAAKKAGPAFSLARYRAGTTRGKANVEALSGYVIDGDGMVSDKTAAVWRRLQALKVRAFGFTTWSHGWRKAGVCCRIVVPFARDVDAAVWPVLWRLLTAELDQGLNDPSTKDACRMHFLPQAPRQFMRDGVLIDNVPPLWRETQGALFDPSPFVERARAEVAAAAKPPALTLTKTMTTTRPSDYMDLGFNVDEIKPWSDRGQGATPTAHMGRRHRARAQAALDDECRKVGGAAEGTRNGSLNTAAFSLGQLLAPGELERGEVEARLAAAGARCGLPAWEVASTIASGINAGEREPRERLTDDDDRTQWSDGDEEEDAAVESAPVDAGWAEEMDRAKRDLMAAMGTSKGGLAVPCDFISYGDLVRLAFPPTSWLVQGLITDGAVAVISGEPKTAKTWLAIELAVAVACGRKALGEFETSAPRGVALFLTEDHKDNARNRLRGTVRGHAGDDDNGIVDIPLVVKSKGTLDLGNLDKVAWFVASVRRALPDGVALVVVDPLRNVMGALKENDNDDMATVNMALRALRDVLGCTVLYVHHTAKTSENSAGRRAGQRMRGASALHGGYDAGIHLTQGTVTNDDGVTVRTASVEVELKAGRAAAPFGVQLRIHDNVAGDCVRADWVFDRQTKQDGTVEAQEQRDEALILSAFSLKDAKPEMTKGALIKQSGGGNKTRMGLAVDRLVKRGALVESAGPRNARMVSLAPAAEAGAPAGGQPPAWLQAQPTPPDPTCSAELFPLKGGEQQNSSIDPSQNSSEQLGTAEQVAPDEPFRPVPEQLGTAEQVGAGDNAARNGDAGNAAPLRATFEDPVSVSG